MANELKTARVTNGTQVKDQLPAAHSALEAVLSFLLGVPLDTVINNPMFVATSAGLRKSIYQDLAGDPAASGELARNAGSLRFHNGGHVGTIPLIIDKDSTAVTVSNTLVNTELYRKPLGVNPLGTTGRLRYTAVGSVSILNANDIFFQMNWLGVSVVVQHRLFGGTTTPRSNLPWKWEILLCMNGATNSWRIFSEIRLQPVELESGLDHPGFGVGNGPTSSLTAEMNGSLDLATSRNFQLSAGWTQASASNVVQYQHSLMEAII